MHELVHFRKQQLSVRKQISMPFIETDIRYVDVNSTGSSKDNPNINKEAKLAGS